MTREEAIRHIIVMLRTPLMGVMRVERDEAIELARKHCITAEDLLVYLSTRSVR